MTVPTYFLSSCQRLELHFQDEIIHTFSLEVTDKYMIGDVFCEHCSAPFSVKKAQVHSYLESFHKLRSQVAFYIVQLWLATYKQNKVVLLYKMCVLF